MHQNVLNLTLWWNICRIKYFQKKQQPFWKKEKSCGNPISIIQMYAQ